jgi:hypothetical protein
MYMVCKSWYFLGCDQQSVGQVPTQARSDLDWRFGNNFKEISCEVAKQAPTLRPGADAGTLRLGLTQEGELQSQIGTVIGGIRMAYAGRFTDFF